MTLVSLLLGLLSTIIILSRLFDIVLLSLNWIHEEFIGVAHFRECFFRIFILLVLVRMEFQRQSLVGLANLYFTGELIHAENVIRVFTSSSTHCDSYREREDTATDRAVCLYTTLLIETMSTSVWHQRRQVAAGDGS